MRKSGQNSRQITELETWLKHTSPLSLLHFYQYVSQWTALIFEQFLLEISVSGSQNKCFNIFITLLKILNHFLSPPSPPPSLLLPFSIDCPLLISWELWVLYVWFPCIFQSYPSIIISLSLSWKWNYPNPSSSRPCSLNTFLFYIFRQSLLSLDLFLNP